MIPKIIHCVWLSGDEKPELYQKCIETWKQHMPHYEIKEWSLKNLPQDVLQHSFVSSALQYKKWAYATDYIRLWLLYTYGGIYMDMDVVVYRPFDRFLHHRAFSSIELNPNYLYKSLKQKEIVGLGIEAAVLGCEKGHPWLSDIMAYYKGLVFENDPKYWFNYIMPRVMTRVSVEKYGFKLVPNYQVLKEDIHLYPCDVFSSIYDFSTLGLERTDEAIFHHLGENPIRHSFHVCAHGWWEDHSTETLSYKVKHFILCLMGKKRIDALKRFFQSKS